MLDFFLNKGGAGITMPRHETIGRVNPLIEAHVRLNHLYEDALRRLANRDVVGQLEAFQKIARADVGKLNETVFSAGGVAYNGTDVEPGSVTLGDGGDDEDLLAALEDREAAFEEQLAGEFDLKPEHHIRTAAVLSVVRANSRSRQDYLKGFTKRRRRTARIETRTPPRTSGPGATSEPPELAASEPAKVGDTNKNS